MAPLLPLLIVMFLPYGIVGTWHLRRFQVKNGWQRFMNLVKTRRTPDKG